MSTDTTHTSGATSESSTSGDSSRSSTHHPEPEATPSEQELLKELSRLGRQIAHAAEVAWQSEQRKELEQDLRKGLTTVVDALEESIQRASQKEETKQFFERAEDMAESAGEKVRTSRAANELAQGLAKGLRSLSDRLEKLSQDLETAESVRTDEGVEQAKPQDSSSGSTDVKDIPISSDS